MKSLLTLFLAVCAIPVLGDATSPVTRAEAASVFAKTDKAMNSVLHFKKAPAAFLGGAGIATREQILAHFSAMYQASEAKFKFTPPPLKPAPEVISLKGADRNLLVKMEVLGLVDRYGPLATSKIDGLTLREFGDTVGYFMARIAELTHMPSVKFSPYLEPGQ